MVTIEQQVVQAEQQVAQTQKTIEARKKEISQARAEAQKIKAQPLTIQRQIRLQQEGRFRAFQEAGGLAGEKVRTQKARQQRLGEITKAEAQTLEAEKQVKAQQQEITRVRGELKERALREQALKLIQKGKAFAAAGSEVEPFVKELLFEQGLAEQTRFGGFGTRLPEETITFRKTIAPVELESKLSLSKTEGLTAFEGSALQRDIEGRRQSIAPTPSIFQRAETFTREKVTDPFIFKPLAKLGVTKEAIGEATIEATAFTSLIASGGVDSKRLQAFKEVPLTQFAGGVTEQSFQFIKEKPLTTTTLVGAGALSGTALGGLRLGAGAIGATKAFKAVEIGTGLGLGGLAAVDIGGKVIKAPTAREKGQVFGEEAVKISAFGLGFGAGLRATRPITTKLPTRLQEPSTLTFREAIKPRASGKTSQALFEIQIRQPAIKGKVQTPLGKFFGTKGRAVQLSRPQTRIIKTRFPLEITPEGQLVRPGSLISGRRGVRGDLVNVRLAELRGGQKGFDIKGFEGLPKEQRFLVRQALEQRLGRPVPEKFVPKLLDKTLGEKQFGRGTIEVETFAKVRKGRIDILPKGRRITRADVFTTGEEIKTISIASKKGVITTKLPQEVSENLIFGEVITKASTKAFPRATGKVSKITGVTKIIQPTPKDTGLPGTILKTRQVPKVSQSTLQTLGEAKAAAVKQLPKPRAVIPEVSVSDRSAFVGGLAASQIGQQASKTLPSTITKPFQKPISEELSRPLIKPTQRPIIKTGLKPVLKPVTKPVLKPLAKPVLKPALKPLQKQAVKPLVKTITKTITKPPASLLPAPTLIKRQPIPRRTLAPIPLKPQRRIGRIFDVQVRRGGKFFTIGRDLSRFRARRAGVRAVAGTLAATFRLLPKGKGFIRDGRRLDPRESGFRKKKKGSRIRGQEVFIERRRFRLRAFPERREIVRAKRLKPRQQRRSIRKIGI